MISYQSRMLATHSQIGVYFYRAIFLLIATFMIGWFTPIAYGQQAINGLVRDKSNQQYLAGIDVKLESAVLKFPVDTVTDSEGKFLILLLSPGEYKITVSATSYQPSELTLNLVPRAVQPVNIEMVPKITVTDVIEVKADRLLLDETQGSSSATINSDFISQLPLPRKNNLPDLISAFVPSAIASHDNFVHLRGNELSLNTSINGVSFIDNPHQYFAPGLDPGAIQSFTVITGGFPAEFSNRFGGIIDAVTKSGFDSNGHGAVTFGSSTFLRHSLSAEYGSHSNKFGYFFYINGFQSLRFINPPEARELHDFGKGLRTFTQLDYKASDNNKFKLLLFSNGSNFEIPNTSEEQLRGRDLFQRSREQTAIFTWEHIISPASLLVSSLSQRLVSTRLLPTNDPISIQASGLRNTVTLGFRSDYTRIVGTRQTIKAGLELTGYRLREDFNFDPRMAAGDDEMALASLNRRRLFAEVNKEDEAAELFAFNFRGRKSGGMSGLYVQDKINIFRNLVANIGLRYDKYHVLTNRDILSPRVNLVYTFMRTSTVLHFAYNRLFSLPPNENLLLTTFLAPNGLDPKPVKSNLFEVGVSQAIKNRVLVKLTSFYRTDRNSFELSELANVRLFLPTTFARGKAYGMELSVQLAEIPKLGISGYFNYTAQRAFQFGPIAGGFTDEVAGLDERFSPAFDQIHTGSAGITYQEHKSGFYTGLAFEYGSGTPQEGVRLPSHFVANIYTGIDILRRESKKVSVQLNVENIGNRVFAVGKESDFTPVQFSSPRFLSGSIRFDF